MQTGDRRRVVLMAGVVVLLGVSSWAVWRIPPRREVVYYDTGARYDPNLLMLGVRAARYGGTPIYADSPAVLLGRADRLELSDGQRERLRQLIDHSRQAARALLTEQQRQTLPDRTDEPEVLGSWHPRIESCESCVLGGPDTDHSHQP